MQHLRTFFLITFNHCNYFPVSFIHCESNCVFSLSLSLFKITAGLCCHTSKGGLSPSGLTWNCFQSGTDGLWDTYWSWPKSNTPQGHWDHMCVYKCKCVRKACSMQMFGKAIHYALNHHFDVRKNTEILRWGQSLWPSADRTAVLTFTSDGSWHPSEMSSLMSEREPGPGISMSLSKHWTVAKKSCIWHLSARKTQSTFWQSVRYLSVTTACFYLIV